jgi:hypothetical protein
LPWWDNGQCQEFRIVSLHSCRDVFGFLRAAEGDELVSHFVHFSGDWAWEDAQFFVLWQL